MINLQQLEHEIFEGEGNSQDKLLRLYGKKLTYKNAAMYIAGIKLHIQTIKEKMKQEEDFAKNFETEPDTIEHHKDKSKTICQDIYLTPDEAASPSVIMQKMGLDPLQWEIISCKIIKGHFDVTMKMENSEVIDGEVIKSSEPLTVRNRKYSVELRVKPIQGTLTFPQVLSAFEDLTPVDLNEYTYEVDPLDGLLFEVPMMDFHFGKHAWSEESGDDYDLKIAEMLWRKSILDLMNESKRYPSKARILYPIGQDFFHFDTPGVTTTAGTQLNSDSRWEKVFRKGVDLLVWGIEQLREIAPVDVIWVPGNHDQMLSYAATVGLAQRYYATDSVNVDLISYPRKYYLFGKNLIGYSHGEKEGKRLEGLMQIEAPKDWGESIFREFHMGHLHSEMSQTKNGIIFRRISAITGTDAWHAEHGFVGSTRKAQAFLWHKTLGLRAILNSNVMVSKDEVERIAT